MPTGKQVYTGACLRGHACPDLPLNGGEGCSKWHPVWHLQCKFFRTLGYCRDSTCEYVHAMVPCRFAMLGGCRVEDCKYSHYYPLLTDMTPGTMDTSPEPEEEEEEEDEWPPLPSAHYINPSPG